MIERASPFGGGGCGDSGAGADVGEREHHDSATRITIENISGEIEAKNMNGQVTITNVSGSVVAHSMNGKIVAVAQQVTAGQSHELFHHERRRST